MSNLSFLKTKSFLFLAVALVVLPIVVVLASKFGLEKNREMRDALNKYQQLPPLPDFNLVDQFGDSIHRKDLNGKFVVASFFFTRCAGPCPKTMAEMARVCSEFKGNRHLVLLSFTVDADYDSVNVIHKYASKFGADTTHQWRLLTGPKNQITDLITKGLLTGVDSGDGTPESITHSTKFVMIDDKGKIRNYYDGLNPAEVNKMMEHLAFIMPRGDGGGLEIRKEKER